MSGLAMAQATFEPPLSCTAQAAGTPSIRDNGVAELVGDVLILCTGGRPRPQNEILPQINIQIFTQPVINITSRHVYSSDSWGQFNEALLFVDEPAPGAQQLCGSTNAPDSAQPHSGQAQVVGVCGAHAGTGLGFVGPGGGMYGTGIGSYSGAGGPTVTFVNPAPLGFPIGLTGACPGGSTCSSYVTRRPNTFQGRQAGNNSVIFQGIPIDPPGTVSTRVFRITNVRVNASQLNNPRGLQSTVNLIISTSASGVTNPISMPITNPAPTVALAQTPLDYAIADGPDTFLQCQNQNHTSDDPFSTDPSQPLNTTGMQGSQFALRFSERFPTVFRRRSNVLPVDVNTPGDPTTLDQDVLGLPYQTETGHYKPSGGSNWNTSGSSRGGSLTDARTGAGVATHGTRLLARFANLPNGARLWVGAALNVFQIGTTSVSTGWARATVSDSNGGGTFGAIEPGTTSVFTQYSGRLSASGLVEVVPVGGNGYMTWEILNANTTIFERVEVPVVVTYAANTSNNLPTLGTARSDGQLAPLSTRSTAGTGSAAPIPRFVEDATNNGKNIFTINACVTNLLFPFVSNQGGFDTGLAIANTSKDPFGTALQTGACTVNFYGTVGTSKVCLSHPSPSITGGEHFAWSLANGGAVTATAGFQGYVIAQCAFQYAHGFAFISDLGAQKLAQGYLALILDDDVSGTRTGSVSEVLGH
jgi:hypothetical protein